MVPEHLLARWGDDDRYEAEHIALTFYNAVDAAFAAAYDRYKGGSRNEACRAVLMSMSACKAEASAAYLKAWRATEARLCRTALGEV